MRRSNGDAAVETRAIALEGLHVDYLLTRRRGKRGVSLRVDHRGLAVLSALSTPLSDIEKVLNENQRWVLKKVADWSCRQVPEMRWEQGAEVPYLGAKLRIELIDTLKLEAVERHEAKLIVATREINPGRIQKLVVAWYKREAIAHLAQRAFHFARLHALPMPKVSLSSALGRWGSCNMKREVRLAWRLIKAPAAQIDYVVCHELAHLRHMNHSAQFWQEVELMCSDYKALREQLHALDHHYRAF